MKLVTIVGARPQFIKAAVLSRELAFEIDVEEVIIHTGQHFDENMSDIFFDELGIPAPRYNLGINGSSHGVMVSEMLVWITRALEDEDPDAVIVYGDTNSTFAGALAASMLNIPVVHVEAGVRSGNMRMPEERNRVITDHISTLRFAPTVTAFENLKREGLSSGSYFTGDIMYDIFLWTERVQKLKMHNELPDGFGILTLHREEHTALGTISEILFTIAHISRKNFSFIMPVHPRVKNLIDVIKGAVRPEVFSDISFVEPMSYFDMNHYIRRAGVIVTDSGGLQREAYFAGVPCITIQKEPGTPIWPETIRGGLNRIIEPVAPEIDMALKWAIDEKNPTHAAPFGFGDGKASQKIADLIINRLS